MKSKQIFLNFQNNLTTYFNAFSTFIYILLGKHTSYPHCRCSEKNKLVSFQETRGKSIHESKYRIISIGVMVGQESVMY